jgi:activated CDC42 kinase 1
MIINFSHKKQVSRVSHFDYVTTEDLMGIGISKPAARRLLETVKKRKGTLKKKIIQTFINSSGNTNKERASIEKIVEHPNKIDTNTLTCLIKESVSLITLVSEIH